MALKIDEIGIWSEIKLAILQDYLSAYTTILSNRGFKRFVYIDAFAGAGEHRSRTTGDIVPGSPQIALQTEPPFSEYHFIDLDGDRTEHLRQIAGDREDVHVHQGDCNDILINAVLPKCRFEDYARGLCILDPYKLNFSWKVMTKIGSMRSVEAFYNFMIMDANRNILLNDPKQIEEEEKARMDVVWGDRSWYDEVYRDTGQLALFDESSTDEVKLLKANERITTALRKRLLDIAGFKYVPEPIPMRNSIGRDLYYLYFASPNKTANKIVRDVFDKYRS
jgi:three-Cys-motif partner protein